MGILPNSFKKLMTMMPMMMRLALGQNGLLLSSTPHRVHTVSAGHWSTGLLRLHVPAAHSLSQKKPVG